MSWNIISLIDKDIDLKLAFLAGSFTDQLPSFPALTRQFSEPSVTLISSPGVAVPQIRIGMFCCRTIPAPNTEAGRRDSSKAAIPCRTSKVAKRRLATKKDWQNDFKARYMALASWCFQLSGVLRVKVCKLDFVFVYLAKFIVLVWYSSFKPFRVVFSLFIF